MNKTVKQLLEGRADCHMLPFFWQHGEDEATLREYMAAIHGANCRAVCVESRPHPDFAGEKWWRDMDIILDEARKRDMQVWILDDSHFPTGYANGALKDAPEDLCKQNIFLSKKSLFPGKVTLDLRAEGLLEMPQEKFDPGTRHFSDDSILFVLAQKADGEKYDLTELLNGETLCWEVPEGDWTLLVGVRSRNTGSRRDHISITHRDSVRLLIDAVYEPHWQHYAADFGKTIQGFFSDEPELGNGPTYAMFNYLGTDQDLPWGPEVEDATREALGDDWRSMLPLLWLDGEDAPRVRSLYMDRLTKLVRENFSRQLGDWCRDHGVRYIGHLIEDNGQHCRTGCSMGHYFRGLQGQHMAGIDNIGGQVLPQGEDDPTPYFLGGGERKGEFYHYALAKLAQSAAAIEPGKHGDAMCEIFGNYGWVEGVRMEKYMADHFLVRGINQFVPHAFSAKKYPDPDCPPHFYAGGHDPLYRHFGKLCAYMDRVATLTSSGKHEVPVAVLYHGESEWADNSAMPFEKPLRKLYDRQIDCHVVPADIFAEKDHYRTQMGVPLGVNGQAYHAFIVPQTDVLPLAAVEGLTELAEQGLPIFFVGKHPRLIGETGEAIPDTLKKLPVVPLDGLYEAVAKLGLKTPIVSPASDRMRILHIHGDTPIFFLVNEDDRDYTGSITFPVEGSCYLYDPWDNVCRAAKAEKVPSGTRVELTVEPLKTVAVVFGSCEAPFVPPIICEGEREELNTWQRSLCEGAEHPHFGEAVPVTTPEDIALEDPVFSGFARYERVIEHRPGEQVTLEITHADEAVEVFLNGKSLGLQIAPPYRYRLTEQLLPRENRLAIEVATTLERQTFPLLDDYGRMVTKPPAGKTGLTGNVYLYRK